MQGKKDKHKKPPPGARPCPPGWDGPQSGGCCTKRWSPACAATCSASQCSAAGSSYWEFQWLDFRVHPYTCCPRQKPASSKYIGGQPLCPIGWAVEPKTE